MTSVDSHVHRHASRRLLLNKVPEVTLYFWVIKVLCTTVGESAADFLNVNLNFGLSGTSLVTGVLLVISLVAQFRTNRYIPVAYWLAVALVSVFGTLVTDNLTDNLGVPLEASTLIFSILLALTFLGWYRSERTLSIHTIVTSRRESFYWCTVLFTFALGTAAGDLMAEVLGLGYLVTGMIVAAMIFLTAVAWRIGLHPVLAFWFIYVLTRPLGASIGDYLAQPPSHSGLGLGATLTSLIFVVGIILTVGYLSLTRADVTERRLGEGGIPTTDPGSIDADTGRGGLRQTVVLVAAVLIAAGTGYVVRKAALEQDTTPPVAAASAGDARVAQVSPLGDLSAFRVITQDTLNLLSAGNQSGATTRVTDLETAWDDAEARLKPKDKAAWTDIDGKIDTVLRQLRSTTPDPVTEKAALNNLLTALGRPASAQPQITKRPSGRSTRFPRLGDLSAFRVITQDTLNLLSAGNQSGATTRVTDLETAWDDAEARLKPKDKAAWTDIDGRIDTVLRQLRSTTPNPVTEKASLTALLSELS